MTRGELGHMNRENMEFQWTGELELWRQLLPHVDKLANIFKDLAYLGVVEACPVGEGVAVHMI